MKMRSMLLYVAISVALSGCVTTNSNPSVTSVNGACTAFRVINPVKEDTLETKKQVLTHNRTYRAVCGGTNASN